MQHHLTFIQCAAPKVFEIAFALLKPFLHERTKNKISIYSHEPNVWKTALLAEINPEELPVAYGGTMTDPDGDPNCKAMVFPHIIFDHRKNLAIFLLHRSIWAAKYQNLITST